MYLLYSCKIHLSTKTVTISVIFSLNYQEIRSKIRSSFIGYAFQELLQLVYRSARPLIRAGENPTSGAWIPSEPYMMLQPYVYMHIQAKQWIHSTKLSVCPQFQINLPTTGTHKTKADSPKHRHILCNISISLIGPTCIFKADDKEHVRTISMYVVIISVLHQRIISIYCASKCSQK